MERLKISVYTADTDVLCDGELFEKVYNSVTLSRRKKTDSLHLQKDRRLSLGAEYLLMSACRDYGIDYSAEEIMTDENGKPYFAHVPLRFNLSHSFNRAMCVISELPVGCDTEKIHCLNHDIAGRFFHKDEISMLDRCNDVSERTDQFFRLWTLKESFIKCVGLGIKIPLNSFCFKLQEDGTVEIEQNLNRNNYYFFESNGDNGYKYAVCIENSTDEKFSFDLSFKRIIIV